MANFGSVLRRLIEDVQHLSQRAFAEKAGISTETLNRALNAKTAKGMNPTTYRAIATALDMTPQQLDGVWARESGTEQAVKALASVVRDPDAWLKKFAAFLARNPERAREIISEVDQARESSNVS